MCLHACQVMSIDAKSMPGKYNLQQALLTLNRNPKSSVSDTFVWSVSMGRVALFFWF